MYSKKEIHQFAKQAQNQFIKLLDYNPHSAFWMFARLMRFAQYDPYSQKVLSGIEKRLNKKHLHFLITEMESIPATALQDEFLYQSVELLRDTFFRNPCYFKWISYEKLLSFACDYSREREILIALCRKQIRESCERDPFENFNYQLLKQGGVEQNYLLTAIYFSKCKTLPYKFLQHWAADQERAKRLLIEFSATPHFYKISVLLLEKHPDLSYSLAKKWKSHLQTLPLSPTTATFVAHALKDLKAKFPAFKAISMNKRYTRYQEWHVPEPPQAQQTWMAQVAGVGLLAWLARFGVPYAGNTLALSTMTWSGSATWTAAFAAYTSTALPLWISLGVYAGGSYLMKRRRSSI